MAISGLRWPTKDEYDLAIQQWQKTVLDPDVRGGTLSQDAMGISSFGGANLYVTLYKIGNWMIRCFCANPPNQTPPDIVERYQAIDRFCRSQAGRIAALLPTTLIEKGLVVGERVLPFVKMPFLAGAPPLGEFIADHYAETTLMQQLSERWFRMIGELEAASMAHGDLDLTNVLVEQQGTALRLKLIDYDNVWIPELAGHGQTEYGHAAFQHPAFFASRTRPYAADMDRFSALVIYISLRMLSHRPELYAEWHADESEQLLFAEADYQAADLATGRIAQMRKLSHSDVWPFIDELSAALRERRMPRSLGAINASVRQSASAAQSVPLQRPLLAQGLAVANWEQKIYNGASSFKPVIQPRPSDASLSSEDVAPTTPLISTPAQSSAMPVVEEQSQAKPGPSKATMRTNIVIAFFVLVIVALVIVIVLFILTATHALAFVVGYAMLPGARKNAGGPYA